MMPFIKPVITDPYFERPVWIENEVSRKAFVCLSADSDTDDIELFLLLLFGYNNVDAKLSFKDACEELFKEDSVAISGGVAFFEDDNKFILPSCCCGLEDWMTIKESIKNKNSPWLGHDPFPGITYHEDFLIVWSDDPKDNNNDLINIRFTLDSAMKCLEEAESDLLGFIQNPLYQWIDSRDKDIAARMNKKIIQWFFKGKID